jgi:hypothetical protein
MKTIFKKLRVLSAAILFIGLAPSCKNTNESVVKVFVRSASNQLEEGAMVIIVGDVSSNPATNPYVDTLITNSSGFATFNVAPYYDAANKEQTVAYFDIIAKTDTKTAEGSVRSRAHTTAVETVFLPL